MNTPTLPTISIEVTQKIDLQRIEDLLCGAFEGGSNYWYQIEGYIKPTTMTFKGDCLDLLKEGEDPMKTFRYLTYPLNEGGAVIISAIEDSEDDEPETFTLNLESIKKGLQTMANKYPYHFNNFIQENDDADTSDVFLQCCLFGEVIFG